MPGYIDFKCPIEKCRCHKKIIHASRSEIISHLLDHDYTQLLEQAVEFQIINEVSERRSPYWIAEQLLDFCINQVDYQ